MLNPVRSLLWLSAVMSFLVLASCGGGSSQRGFLDLPDLSAQNIELEGVDLLHRGEVVDTFNPDITGPYTASVSNEVDKVNVTVTLPEGIPDNVEITIQERFLNDDNRVELEIFDLVNGVPFSLSLKEGDNTFSVVVRETENRSSATYRLEIIREGTSALLSNIRFFVDGGSLVPGRANDVDDFRSSDSRVRLSFLERETIVDPDTNQETTRTWPTSFDSADRDYTLITKYDVCAVGITPVTEQKLASVEFNGESVDRLQVINNVLSDNNEDLFNIHVTSEVGGNEDNYSVRILRLEPTIAELAVDPRLATLSFSQGLLEPSFVCEPLDRLTPAALTLLLRNDINQQDTPLSLTLSTISPATTVSIGRVQLDENGQAEITISGDNVESFVIDPNTKVNITPGQAFPDYSDDNQQDDNLFSNLTQGSHLFAIDTEIPGANNTVIRRQYQLIVIVSSRNFIEVSTSEALREALINASPNDEIVIESGVYEGLSDLSQSANENAHFYSNQSGTADQPILVRAQSGEVLLQGTGENDTASIFLLEGDYWQVSGLSFSNGFDGVVVQGGSNNWFSGSDFENLGGRGIVIDENSHSNTVLLSSFSEIGSESRDVDGEVAGEAILVEGDSNIITQNDFSGEFATNSEVIDIKPSADIVNITFNQFDLTSGLANASPVLQASADQSFFAHNDMTFSAGSAQNYSSVLAFSSADNMATIQADVYSNIFETTTDGVNFLFANRADVSVTDNTLVSGESISYGDTAVDESFVRPKYQIINGDNMCMTLTNITSEVFVAFFNDPAGLTNAIVFEPCVQSNPNQIWFLESDGEGFVLIRNDGEESRRLVPSRNNDLNLIVRAFAEIAEGDDLDFLNDGFVYRWRLITQPDGSFSIHNKDNLVQAISVSDGLNVLFPGNVIVRVDGVTAAIMAPFTNSSEFKFSLLQVN